MVAAGLGHLSPIGWRLAPRPFLSPRGPAGQPSISHGPSVSREPGSAALGCGPDA